MYSYVRGVYLKYDAFLSFFLSTIFHDIILNSVQLFHSVHNWNLFVKSIYHVYTTAMYKWIHLAES